jgi:hypothetical protein
MDPTDLDPDADPQHWYKVLLILEKSRWWNLFCVCHLPASVPIFFSMRTVNRKRATYKDRDKDNAKTKTETKTSVEKKTYSNKDKDGRTDTGRNKDSQKNHFW